MKVTTTLSFPEKRLYGLLLKADKTYELLMDNQPVYPLGHSAVEEIGNGKWYLYESDDVVYAEYYEQPCKLPANGFFPHKYRGDLLFLRLSEKRDGYKPFQLEDAFAILDQTFGINLKESVVVDDGQISDQEDFFDFSNSIDFVGGRE